MTSDSTPAFEIEKEALKTEIETSIQAGVDHLEAKTAKRKDADKYHNTRHLLKQYRKVAYAIQISEADMNVRMEMEHGTRLSTLEVNDREPHHPGFGPYPAFKAQLNPDSALLQ